MPASSSAGPGGTVDLERFFQGIGDANLPWWQRALRLVQGGTDALPHLARAYEETFGALAIEEPLRPGKWKVTVNRNANGETVAKLRAHTDDMRLPERRAHVVARLAQQLDRRFARAS